MPQPSGSPGWLDSRQARQKRSIQRSFRAFSFWFVACSCNALCNYYHLRSNLSWYSIIQYLLLLRRAMGSIEDYDVGQLIGRGA